MDAQLRSPPATSSAPVCCRTMAHGLPALGVRLRSLPATTPPCGGFGLQLQCAQASSAETAVVHLGTARRGCDDAIHLLAARTAPCGQALPSNARHGALQKRLVRLANLLIIRRYVRLIRARLPFDALRRAWCCVRIVDSRARAAQWRTTSMRAPECMSAPARRPVAHASEAQSHGPHQTIETRHGT